MPIIQTEKVLRPRELNDHYPTPVSHVRAALSLIPQGFTPTRILDPGAGDGVWGREARKLWPMSAIMGSELRETMVVEGREYLLGSEAYDGWHTGDFLSTTLRDFQNETFDLVVGNIPYKFAESFLRKSFDFLEEGGYMVQLLRLAFLEGQRREKGFWREFPLFHCAVCSDRPSFTGVWRINPDTDEPYFVADGKTDATAYGYFCWQKGWRGTTTLSMLHSRDVVLP